MYRTTIVLDYGHRPPYPFYDECGADDRLDTRQELPNCMIVSSKHGHAQVPRVPETWCMTVIVDGS